MIRTNEFYTKEIIYKKGEVFAENLINDNASLKNILTRLSPDTFPESYSSKQDPPVKQTEPIITTDFLEANKNPWKYFQPLYFEDFSNYKSPHFLNYIWNKFENDKYACEVKNKRYFFEIKKTNMIGHKYISSSNFSYDTSKEATPFSVRVKINAEPKCSDEEVCYGRGLTVRFSKNSSSFYAFTLNDQGELRFLKGPSLRKPNEVEVLQSFKMDVTPGKEYELGIICMKNKFYLYFEKENIQVLEDSTYQSGFNGVICFGSGEHYFDDVLLHKSTFVK